MKYVLWIAKYEQQIAKLLSPEEFSIFTVQQILDIAEKCAKRTKIAISPREAVAAWRTWKNE